MYRRNAFFEWKVDMQQLYYEYRKDHSSIRAKSYVYGIGSYHYNWHDDLEILLLLRGQVEACANGTSVSLGEDDLILIDSNIGHATLGLGQDNIAMVLRIAPGFLKEYYEDAEFLMLDLQRIDGEKRKETVSKLRRDMAEMMLCQIDGSPESRLSFDASFYHLMNTIIAAAPPLRMHKSAVWTNQKKQQAIMEMVKYIDRNYREKITLEILAREAGYNPSYVSQLFKSCMGINFFEYLTRVRLREATLALSCSEKKILDIALEHGFSDLKSFNFTFKNTFRKSPAEYRRQLNREHLGNDAVFKKSFITADDPRAMEKILAYREGKNTKDLRTPGAPDPVEFSCRTREMASMLEETSRRLAETAVWFRNHGGEET